jgi:hypothetical protein
MPKFYAEVPKGYIGAVAVAQADSKEHALELINRTQREAGNKEIQLDAVVPFTLDKNSPVIVIGNGDY